MRVNYIYHCPVFSKYCSIYFLKIRTTVQLSKSGNLTLIQSNPRSIPKDQSWMFIGRTDVEAETPILWPPAAKKCLIWKDHDAQNDWRWEKKGTSEDEMVGWHDRLNGHEFEWTPGVGDGQGGLVCCSPWGHKESETTEQLNWTKFIDDMILYI